MQILPKKLIRYGIIYRLYLLDEIHRLVNQLERGQLPSGIWGDGGDARLRPNQAEGSDGRVKTLNGGHVIQPFSSADVTMLLKGPTRRPYEPGVDRQSF